MGPTPAPVVPRPRHRDDNAHRRLLGRMDRCSELTSAAAPHTPRDFHLGRAFGSNRTTPTDIGSADETDHACSQNELGWVLLRSLTNRA